MVKILHLIVTSISILTALIWAVIQTGHSQPTTAFFSNLTTCDNRPCYYGIVPGITTWEAADAILQQVPGIHLESTTDLGRNYGGPQGEIRLDRNAVNGPVTRIQLTPPENTQNQVGVFLTRFGTPCGIMPDFLLERMKIFYQGTSAIVQPASVREIRHPHPTSPIYSVSLFDMGNAPLCTGFDKSVQGWLGFRPY